MRLTLPLASEPPRDMRVVTRRELGKPLAPVLQIELQSASEETAVRIWLQDLRAVTTSPADERGA